MTDDNDKHNGVTSPILTSLYKIFSARHAGFNKVVPVKNSVLSATAFSLSLILRSLHYTVIFNTKDRKVKCHCARLGVLAGSGGKELDRGEWSVSRPARFAPWEMPWYLLRRGLGGLYSRSGRPCLESNDDSWVIHVTETVGKKETLIFCIVFKFWSSF